MKKIKVKYCKYGNTDERTPLTYNYFVHNILTKYYDVETSEKPDYIFYYESAYEYLKYDCIRIFTTGENLSPNFNLCDYATGIDYISFGDRYYRFPPYFIATFYSKRDLEIAKDIDLEHPKLFTEKDLSEKKDFCSFVYSNYLADEQRDILFDKINSYKKINSGGKYRNNIGGRVENKLEFELTHKFSMAIENSCRDGYTTDRILNSLYANTIPIYWGNPAIGREFNTERFINCHEYESFDAVVERIKEIDTNDSLYLEIINKPVFAENYSFKKNLDGFESFLKNIFDQPIEKAKRRTINLTHRAEMENKERMFAKIVARRALARKILAILYQPFKRSTFLEKLKRNYFRSKVR